MLKHGNDISEELRSKLRSFKWSPNNFLDLHKLGVHYFDPDILPTWIDMHTHASLYHRGLTQPNALPSYFEDNVHERIKDWYKFNYFKLYSAGIHLIGNEPNLQREEDFEKASVRAMVLRISDYETCDGSFGHYTVSQFAHDFMDDLFVDYSFLPLKSDLGKYLSADIPIWFGNITKRPLTDFDIVVVSHCYPGERIDLPFAMARSGIPLYRWERWDADLPYYEKCPIFCIAGIGSAFTENLMGDHPIYGSAENSLVDGVLIGEGELMWLKFLQQYQQTVVQDGKSKREFLDKLTNVHHQGFYDPRVALFEYSDKKHVISDPAGNVLDTVTWKGGGRIKRVSLIDEFNQKKYVMAVPWHRSHQLPSR